MHHHPSHSHLPPSETRPPMPPPRRDKKDHRPAVILLSVILLAGLLAGCSLLTATRRGEGENESDTSRNQGTTESSPSDGHETASETVTPLPSDPSIEDLRLYYEALLAQMNDTLLEERAEWFMNEYNYRERIKELEKALEEAKGGQDAADGSESEAETSSRPVSEKEPSQPSQSGEATGGHAGDRNDGTPGGPLYQTDTPLGGGDSHQPSNQPDEGKPSDPAADYTYIVSDGQVTIQGYKGSGGAVTIPTSLEGLPVVAIADDAFKNKDVTSVAIPDGVERIGWFAFYGCHALERVTVPTSVTAIAYAAFEGCPSLTLYCASGSYAAEYADSFGIRHQTI